MISLKALGAIVQTGNVVYIHYVGVSASTGEQFDSSWDRGRSEFIGYISGTGNVIQGLDEGLLGMQVGGRRTVVIPPDLAYGENGAGDGLIAPNETLIFTVDLLGTHSASLIIAKLLNVPKPLSFYQEEVEELGHHLLQLPLTLNFGSQILGAILTLRVTLSNFLIAFTLH